MRDLLISTVLHPAKWCHLYGHGQWIKVSIKINDRQFRPDGPIFQILDYFSGLVYFYMKSAI